MSYGVKGSTPKCYVHDCNNLAHSHGLCPKHYQRWRRYGAPIRIMADHGMHDTPIYHRWEGMNQRCHNPKHDKYHQYGSKGITVCEDWRHSFINFYRDMGDLPSPIHQIDRIDGKKGYFKENCRWVLPTQNVRNSSATKLIAEKVKEIKRLKSQDTPTREIARLMKISSSNINRILRGEIWKELEAMSI